MKNDRQAENAASEGTVQRHDSDWVDILRRKPTDDGLYIVFAPSDDPEAPLYAMAWFHTDRQEWSLLVRYWANAITHWMPLPNPPNTKDETSERSE